MTKPREKIIKQKLSVEERKARNHRLCKRGVVHTEILLPPYAPPSFSDRAALWNSVELYEKAGNAQLAREIDAALPIELSREEQIRFVREYCSTQFVSKGMCVDFAIYDTGSGNPHCHIMFTMQPLDERGIDEIPAVHMGVAACQMEKKGITTEKGELNLWNAASRYLHANLPKGTKSLPVAEWEQEYAELKTQRTSDYTKLKAARAEVAELQKIRRCVDIVLKAEQPEQTRAKRHDLDR